ncbi:MAG: S8 family serine peptidase [Planctomycetes bacterium]|nr:S8 family serine peptidase [Planctomycetota bacterium]
MLLKRALCVGLFLFAGMALAQYDPKPTAGKPVPDRPSAQTTPSPSGSHLSQTGPSGEPARVSVGDDWGRDDPALAPRKPTPKTPTAQLGIPQDATGKLIIKFRDEVKARPTADGTVRSLANRNLDEVQAIIDQFEVSLSRLINHPDGKLAELEARAAAHSGKAQPDLAGMMYIEGPQEKLQGAARALNELQTVEWVIFEVKKYPFGGLTGACCVPDLGQCIDDLTLAQCIEIGGEFQGNGTLCEDIDCMFPGACCVDDDCTDGLTEEICLSQGGKWAGPLTDCEDTDCDIACGHELTGDCYTVCGNGNAFCDNEVCCDLVCGFDPFCCDENDDGGFWDALCAAQANFLCEEPPGGGCASPLNGSCFKVHSTGGCDDEACCNIVTGLNPNCANVWGPGCVTLAIEFCVSPPDPTDVTPDFTPLQGYLTPQGYDPLPPDLVPFLPPFCGGFPFLGFGGHGWNLGNSLSPAGDDPDNPDYPGLYGLGQRLIDVDGHDAFGEGNLTLGKTMKVAIIEWGYYQDHEDLLEVILEPGQTLLSDPAVTVPEHGTATLSIAVAKQNGIGMTGIALEAQGYFFPLTSLEEGPREFAAWTSALLTLGPGDVISASYGPGPETGNLNNSQENWTLIRLASDLGITCCIAAGNACYNLDNAPDLGDSGGMVVGACSPGFPWYRLAFSNYCTDPPLDNSSSNVVHVKAWGTIVASAGYGLLFNGIPTPDRSYTPLFGGTSAAAPQIAGLVACLQGLAKQFYGITIMPEQIRFALGAPGIPPPNPPRLFGGFPEGPGVCGLDLDPDLGPHMIGPYPDVAGNFGSAASSILNQSPAGFDDAPLIDGITVLRGNLIYGNVFSIKGSDNNYFVIESEYTTPSHSGGGPENPQYITFGEITDVLVTAHARPPGASALLVEVESHTSSGTSIMFVELWDWGWNRYAFVGFTPLFGDDFVFPFAVDGAARYINPSDQRVLIRVWTLSLGGNPPPGFGLPPNSYRVHHDLINLQLFEDFGDIFEPSP